jgi:hypothetical protein
MDGLNVEKLTIREILQQHPETITVFIQLNTQCVGCAFEHFCTLTDVAVHYPVSLETLTNSILNEIRAWAKRIT